MESLEFSVDHELCLVSVNETLAKLCPATVEHLGRSPYFDVLPRILIAEQDAVRQVLRDGQGLQLPRVDFACFLGMTPASVEIQPLGECGAVSGAQVRVRRHHQCAMAERLGQVEHLVDIGKMASSLAHGVRNPLNAIKGAVVYLRSEERRVGKEC